MGFGRSLITLAGLILACSPGQATQAMPPFTVTQIAAGDYVRQGECAEATSENLGGIANTGFVVGRDAVAVIDPGGSLADGRRLREAIGRVTPLPVRYVIMTHAHPDHVFGAGAFAGDHPAFVGHAGLPGVLASRGEYDRKRLAAVLGEEATGRVVMPDMLVAGERIIDLGGRRLVLRAQGPAHTDSDLTVLDEASSTLWMGDLLFVGRVPALDGNLKGWLAVLHGLQAVPAARAVPGHGPVSVAWPAGAADELRYLGALLHDVRAAIAHGQDVDEAVGHAAQGERERWALFDAYNGRNTITAYKELQWE